MGRGNVCVFGPYEGLYYIDKDQFTVYRKDDEYGDFETALAKDLSYEDITGSEWSFDDWMTDDERDEIEQGFVDDFTRKFPSFKDMRGMGKWVRDSAYGNMTRVVLAESNLFYVCAEDNEWSIAIELIQKESPWSFQCFGGLQKRHYRRYLEGMRDSLFTCVDELGVYTGAWTSGTIRREDIA